jgi:predicted TIM-barrel fold metal-dependent hydrolase
MTLEWRGAWRLAVGVAFAVGGLVLGCAAAPTADPRGGLQWIDVHAHLLGGREATQDWSGAVQAALSAMRESGIIRMIVMPPPQTPGGFPLIEYESFLGAIKRHPTRFAFLGGGGSLNAMIQDTPESAVSDRVRRRFEDKAAEILRAGAAGFGEITAHHLSHTTGHPYESVPADHPLLRLLGDIAVRHDVVIDFHFDVVAEDTKLPAFLQAPPNPPFLRANLAPFERLLEHNRRARIVLAHVGSDILGHLTVELSRRLLTRHPNLSMSLRLGPVRVPENHPLTHELTLKPEWLHLFRDFPDRFVIGTDQFIASPTLRGAGPGLTFAQFASRGRQRARAFLDALPPDLARRIGYENALRLYKLRGEE